jgi:peptide-methionine (S)-S-oxide reductase
VFGLRGLSSRILEAEENAMFKLFLAATFLSSGFLSGTAASFAATDTAVFAGGCFWCVESDMDKVNGVVATTSGFSGGSSANPTYKSHDGHTEAVKVEFDPAVVSYDALVNHFLRTIDVTDAGGQFCDRGSSYVSAVFAIGKEQAAAADKAIARARADLGKDIATPVTAFTSFTAAEDYHQNYYLGSNRVITRFGIIKQSEAYKKYREGCGRDQRVKEVWGKAAYSFPAGGDS